MRSPQTILFYWLTLLLKHFFPILALTLALLAPRLAITEGLPELGDPSDAALSEIQERAIGKRIMVEVRSDRTFIDDAELSDYINALGNRLVAASPGATSDNRRDFEFFLLNDDSINAFALLGGFIGVHSGLVLATSNESELASVMGHEISHILQRHQARGMASQKNAALWQLVGLAAAILASRSNSSSSSAVTEAAITSSMALSYQNQLDYSREFEREADRLGLQVMDRASFDPQGMATFFERLQRASRYNDSKAPGYLRSHPLTSERIADMQDRISTMMPRHAPDSMDYRMARAKLRVMTSGINEAITFFRAAIAEKTILRDRADVYGLALALKRTRDFAGANRELATVRASGETNPWIELLAAQIRADQRQWKEALAIYKNALKQFPDRRALFYGYVDTLFEAGQTTEGLAAVTERLRNIQDDPKLYDLAAKGYALNNKRLAQHRSLGESYYRRGNLIGAIEQLEIALKARDGDFYELSGTEARLREFKAELRTRAPVPGEKRAKEP